MGKIQMIPMLLLSLLLALPLQAQRLEPVQYGDFESWTLRNIKESALLGGQVKTLYVVGPSKTIDGNYAYDYASTIWASSNAYAKVCDVTKVSISVFPDDGPTGKCAKLETVLATCKVAGIINIQVLAAGSLYWGKVREPIDGVYNPYSHMEWGIPFTGRPSALVMDYKALIPNEGVITKASTAQKKTFAGYDPEEVILILQKRWEDADGNIHASRVGTAIYHIAKSTSGWVKGGRFPVLYGDISTRPDFKPYMGLFNGSRAYYARNSKGKVRPILEEAWADSDETPTHAILMINSSSCGAYVGALGNVLWVDNIKLEYGK